MDKEKQAKRDPRETSYEVKTYVLQRVKEKASYGTIARELNQLGHKPMRSDRFKYANVSALAYAMGCTATHVAKGDAFVPRKRKQKRFGRLAIRPTSVPRAGAKAMTMELEAVEATTVALHLDTSADQLAATVLRMRGISKDKRLQIATLLLEE